MKIGVDLRVLAAGRRTGVEEYTIGLLDELLPLASQHEWFLFYNAWRKQKLRFRWLGLPWVRLVERSLPNRPLMFVSTYLQVPKLNWLLGDCDLFFSPHLFPAAVLARTPLVTTFHDLSFLRHPEFSSAKKYWWHRLTHPEWQAQRSAHLITVSESSKRDLVTLYGVSPENVSVIYSGVGAEFRPIARDDPRRDEIRRKYSLPAAFLLYLGTIEPRKNIVGLIEAFGRAVYAGYEGKLVVAGILGWSFSPILKAWQRSAFKERIYFIGFVAPEDKPYLYNLADLFVYPSFFEGFGFPVLEAMACGVPVITARVSSLPEVVGEAAMLIDPGRVDEIAWAITEVLSDGELAFELSERGKTRARQFSWHKAALSTLQCFEKVLY